MLLTTLPIFIFSFFVIWFGAGLIVKSIDKIAKKLKLSTFVISFFLLGLLTSIPEMALGLSAVGEGKPEIFVGNLLGGVVVIFLFIIPLLAILGNGLSVNHTLSRRDLALTLAICCVPALAVIDQRVSNFEGMLLLGAYGFLFYTFQKKFSFFDKRETEVLSIKAYSFVDLLKVALGIGLVFVSSNYIVDQTVAYSNHFEIPAFYIGLIVLSIGTNLPELSLALRGVVSGKKDVAFGDYLGSASANTLLFGVFTMINDGEVLTVNNFFVTFLFIAGGLGLFYYFARSGRIITRREGTVLLSIYVLFVIYELGREFF